MTEERNIEKSDIVVGVVRTLTRRHRGVITLNGKIIGRDSRVYSNKDKALSRAKLIKDFTWLNAVNTTNEEQRKEG